MIFRLSGLVLARSIWSFHFDFVVNLERSILKNSKPEINQILVSSSSSSFFCSSFFFFFLFLSEQLRQPTRSRQRKSVSRASCVYRTFRTCFDCFCKSKILKKLINELNLNCKSIESKRLSNHLSNG